MKLDENMGSRQYPGSYREISTRSIDYEVKFDVRIYYLKQKPVQSMGFIEAPLGGVPPPPLGSSRSAVGVNVLESFWQVFVKFLATLLVVVVQLKNELRFHSLIPNEAVKRVTFSQPHSEWGCENITRFSAEMRVTFSQPHSEWDCENVTRFTASRMRLWKRNSLYSLIRNEDVKA